jgi:hypothetical protein
VSFSNKDLPYYRLSFFLIPDDDKKEGTTVTPLSTPLKSHPDPATVLAGATISPAASSFSAFKTSPLEERGVPGETEPAEVEILLSYPILSYPILSYPILSHPILSYPILSYPLLSLTPSLPTLNQIITTMGNRREDLLFSCSAPNITLLSPGAAAYSQKEDAQIKKFKEFIRYLSEKVDSLGIPD